MAVVGTSEAALAARATAPRHALFVRLTHWIAAISVLALLVTGIEIVISHPRFYWGETGNVNTPALFQIPIPASRATVNTGYDFVLKDQNGWSRSLHFQAAWLIVFAGLFYAAYGARRGHFRRTLLPERHELRASHLSESIRKHLRLDFRGEAESGRYNVLQRVAYLFVVFVLLPFLIWTGLAMSPAVVSAAPGMVTILGGHQSARTLHFFATIALTAFVAVHIAMVYFAGFRQRMRAMITGRDEAQEAGK